MRTAIFSAVSATAVNHKAPIFGVGYRKNDHYRSDFSIEGDDFLLLWRAAASGLILSNLNSLMLDWVARLIVGGTNLSYFLLKQFPVFPPSAYMRQSCFSGLLYLDLILPRVLQLVYTSNELKPFARELGYTGPPYRWDEERRLILKCELDAIYALMYGLDKKELEWVIDADHPSVSFPILKHHELERYGELRTKKLILQAFDLFVSSEGERESI